jgi:small-conductance mechanosensitive channel
LGSFIDIAVRFLPLLATLVTVAGLLFAANSLLRRRWQHDPDAQFRFQLVMLALTFASLLAVILALPVGDEMRGQLLRLIGILLSAAIALSSTTFIGNIMAGIMLKVVKNAKPGDFVTVAELTGRITEMDLLHTEIQTEFRDLVTVPNLYMITHPLQVVRTSGSIITAEVSLGYDITHSKAAEVLCDAAAKAGLSDGFVHVRELGDFSVTYRVAGLLEDIKSLISARSALRVAMLDALHRAGIEIVSPNFMNTRALSADDRFISQPASESPGKSQPHAEDVVFDKAEDAASVEKIRTAIAVIDAELAAPAAGTDEVQPEKKAALEAEKAGLAEQLKNASKEMKAKEFAEKHQASPTSD